MPAMKFSTANELKQPYPTLTTAKRSPRVFFSSIRERFPRGDPSNCPASGVIERIPLVSPARRVTRRPGTATFQEEKWAAFLEDIDAEASRTAYEAFLKSWAPRVQRSRGGSRDCARSCTGSVTFRTGGGSSSAGRTRSRNSTASLGHRPGCKRRSAPRGGRAAVLLRAFFRRRKSEPTRLSLTDSVQREESSLSGHGLEVAWLASTESRVRLFRGLLNQTKEERALVPRQGRGSVNGPRRRNLYE